MTTTISRPIIGAPNLPGNSENSNGASEIISPLCSRYAEQIARARASDSLPLKRGVAAICCRSSVASSDVANRAPSFLSLRATFRPHAFALTRHLQREFHRDHSDAPESPMPAREL